MESACHGIHHDMESCSPIVTQSVCSERPLIHYFMSADAPLGVMVRMPRAEAPRSLNQLTFDLKWGTLHFLFSRPYIVKSFEDGDHSRLPLGSGGSIWHSRAFAQRLARYETQHLVCHSRNMEHWSIWAFKYLSLASGRHLNNIWGSCWMWRRQFELVLNLVRAPKFNCGSSAPPRMYIATYMQWNWWND